MRHSLRRLWFSEVHNDPPNPLRNPRPSHDRLAATYSMVHVMSEVKRFKVDLPGQFNREHQPIDAVFVLASDFDAQRLRADTTEAENRDLRLQCGGMEMDLLAAEQRIACLLGTLSDAKDFFRAVWDQSYDYPASVALSSMGLEARIAAALNQKSEGESQ